MVKVFNDIGQGVFKGTEIDPDAELVKLNAADECPYPPVVAMHIFAGAIIIF